MSPSHTQSRVLQWIGIIIALLVIGGAYWYFQVRAGVKSNTASSQPQGVGRLDSGLAGYWKLDETTGSTAADASTNGNNGTLVNMENGDWTTGQIGNGLTFDGTNEYVIASTISAYDMGTNPFSLSVWFKTTDTSGAIVAKGGTNSGGKRYYIGTEIADCSSGKLKVDIDDDTTKQFVCSTTTVTDNAWHHVILVRTRTSLTLFLDGKSEGTPVDLTGYGSLNSSRDFYIGGAYDESSGPVGDFSGSIDEVRLYNNDLTADEVSQLYRLTSPTSVDTSLKGYWSFDGQDISGTTAYDRSGAGNTGTLTSGPTITQGVAGQALSFDGTNDYVSIGNVAALKNSVFTYSAWVNPNTLVNERNIFGGNAGNTPRFSVTSNGALVLTDTSVAIMGTSTGKIPADAWSHVAVTYDVSGNYIFYINGVDVGSGTNLQTFNFTSASFVISNDSANYFSGSIDEVRVYSRVLAIGEIKSLYDIAAPDKTNSSSSQAQGTGRLDSGLAGYWKFDDVSGATATDASTNGNNATLTGATQTWVSGQIGGALDFNGIDDMGTVAYSTPLTSTTTLSYAFWTKPDLNDSNGFLGALNGEDGSAYNFIRIDNAGAEAGNPIVAIVRTINADLATRAVQFVYPVSTWFHGVYTYDGAYERLYINGKEIGEWAQTGNFATNTEYGLVLGRKSSSIGTNYDGALDEVRVYNRTLSSDEVAQLYRLTTPTSVDTSLKGYWAFNGQDLSGTTAYDRSGTGNNFTLTGSPTATEGLVGQALSFSGSNYASVTPSGTGYGYGTSDFSVSVWAKTSGYVNRGSAINVMIGRSTEGSAGYWYGIAFNSSHKPYFSVGNGTATSGAMAINDDTWHHFTGIRRGSVVELWIDGVKTTDGSTTDDIQHTAVAFNIATDGAGTRYFTGSVDEPRVYNRALASDEIKSLYDIAKPDKTNSSITQPQGIGRLDSGLAGYWKLDENTGTSATDSSTNGNTGTLTNSPTWTTGQIGSAVQFDGTNDTVTVATSPNLELTTAETVSAWIYINTAPSSGNEGGIFYKYSSGDSNYLYRLAIYNNGSTLRLLFAPGGGGGYSYSTTSLATGQWYHVSVTFDRPNVRFYLNGAPDGQTIDAVGGGFASGSGTALIGGGGLGVGYLNGRLDEVRVYNRALSSDEISQLYRLNSPTGTDTSLKGYWSFNGKDLSGTTAYDRSGAGNNGTLTGATAIEGKLGQGLSFDGINDRLDLGSHTAELTLYSLSFWVYQSGSATGQVLFRGTSDRCFYNPAISISSTSISVAESGCSSTGVIGSAPLSVVGWHHVGVTRNGSSVKVYVDGVLVPTTGTPGSKLGVNNPKFVVGANWGDSGGTYAGYFNTQVDEVRTYNRELSASEILGLYNQSR